MATLPSLILRAGLAGILVAAATQGAQAAPSSLGLSSSRVNFTANAFGTFITVDNVVTAGKTAASTLGSCGTFQPDARKANAVAAVDLSPAVMTGEIVTTARSSESIDTQQARATAQASQTNLLDGLIKATKIRAVSTTTRDASGLSHSAAGSTFVGLVVAGIPIEGTPAPNTTLDLIGFGAVTLNEQTSSGNGMRHSFTVNMIHVSITVENPLVPVGTEIVVGHASSAIHTALGGTLDGFAYGTSVNGDDVVQSGRTAALYLGCLGTDGAVKENSVASVEVPPLVTTGVIETTVQGIVDQAQATGETSAAVESVDVGSGLVSAQAVRANAHSFTDGIGFEYSSEGSMFADLHVAGFPDIGDDVGPNTRITLEGVGVLWLRREIRTASAIEVRMIELIVTEENDLGLPVGANIRVSVARASAH
jgi:hypothetical protein